MRARHSWTDLVNDTDSVPARDDGHGHRQKLSQMTGAQDDIDGVHARGVHLDPDRPFAGMRFRRLLDDENIGGSVRVETGSVHGGQLSSELDAASTCCGEQVGVPTR